jgi:hypothetical protein
LLHTLLWERRKDGAFIVWRETAKKRLVAKLQEIKVELKLRRHEPVAVVGAWLKVVSATTNTTRFPVTCLGFIFPMAAALGPVACAISPQPA